MFFFKGNVPLPYLIVEGFTIASKFHEELGLIEMTFVFEINGDADQVLGGEEGVGFFIVEFEWTGSDFDWLELILNVGILEEFFDDDLMAGVELGEGRLKSSLEFRGLGMSLSDLIIEAEVLLIFGIMGGEIREFSFFGIVGVVEDFADEGIFDLFFMFLSIWAYWLQYIYFYLSISK